MMTQDKYECDLKNLTGTFTGSNNGEINERSFSNIHSWAVSNIKLYVTLVCAVHQAAFCDMDMVTINWNGFRAQSQ